jgi:heme exporter protein CcmD
MTSMGRYALYVWGSFAVTLAAMGVEVFVLVRRGWQTRKAR